MGIIVVLVIIAALWSITETLKKVMQKQNEQTELLKEMLIQTRNKNE